MTYEISLSRDEYLKRFGYTFVPTNFSGFPIMSNDATFLLLNPLVKELFDIKNRGGAFTFHRFDTEALYDIMRKMMDGLYLNVPFEIGNIEILTLFNRDKGTFGGEHPDNYDSFDILRDIFERVGGFGLMMYEDKTKRFFYVR